MSHNLPTLPLTPDEKMWLGIVARRFRGGFLVDVDELKRALLQQGKWPKGLRPYEIDDRLLVTENIPRLPGSWQKPTLLGIWHVNPATDIIDKCDQVVRHIKDNLSISKPTAITIEDISNATGIDPAEVSLIIRLLPSIGLPTKTVSGGSQRDAGGVQIPGRLGVFSRMDFDDPEFIEAYLEYENIEGQIEKHLGVNVGGQSGVETLPMSDAANRVVPSAEGLVAPGTLLGGRYQIVRQLGAGGTSTVHLALDRRLHSSVAIKEASRSNEVYARAFEREAQLLANLRHPALPAVIDYFSDQDRQYIVMQYIPGDNLAESLRRQGRPFNVREVLQWADDLLDALGYLHSQNPPIIHRDIKPDNLKLTDRGRVVLLDFGLSKGAAGQMPTLVSSHSVRGFTPPYASLEQLQGSRTDQKSDLYSFAATLYHLLTAVQPARASDRHDALESGQQDPLRPADEVNPEVPPKVATILRWAMRLNRGDRLGNAAEIREALREAAKEAELVSSESSNPSREEAPESEPWLDRALEIDKEVSFWKFRQTWLAGEEASNRADEEVSKFQRELELSAAKLNENSEIVKITFQRHDTHECILFYGVSLLNVSWVRRYNNSLTDAALHITVFERALDGTIVSTDLTKANTVREDVYTFDISKAQEVGWKHANDRHTVMPTKRLAEISFNYLVENIYKHIERP
jgi:serine/threonine protein kinase